MANLQAYVGIDMTNYEGVEGAVTRTTSTVIEITAGAAVARYTGNFTYDAWGDVFGQVRSYQEFFGGTLRLSISDANLDVRLLDSDEPEDILAAVFRGKDRLDGSGSRDILLGYAGSDTINGNGGNDRLDGGAGNDVLTAGTGADKLIGGLGRDTLQGGTDALGDTFVYASARESRVGEADTIRNFTRGADHIDLGQIDVRPGTWGDDDFAWAGKTAAARSVWWSSPSEGLVVLRGDVTGDAVADFAIVIRGIHALGEGDVIL